MCIHASAETTKLATRAEVVTFAETHLQSKSLNILAGDQAFFV